MRNKAIFALYQDVITIGDNAGAFDKNGNQVSIDESLVQAKIAELTAAEPMRLLREERNKLLSETDWRDLPSYQGSNQEAWRTYRQQLRDLPSTTDPSDPTWPTAPEND